MKHGGIIIVSVWPHGYIPTNVICDNRLLNSVNSTLSQELNILWKYH